MPSIDKAGVTLLKKVLKYASSDERNYSTNLVWVLQSLEANMIFVEEGEKDLGEKSVSEKGEFDSRS